MSNFVDDRHALYVGWITGFAARHGVLVEVVTDEHGNYTDRIKVPFGTSGQLTLELIVPYPPEGWTLG